MSVKLLLRLLLLLLLALALWGGVALLRGPGRDALATLALPTVPDSAADTIAIVGPADTLLLARTAGGWTVNGFAAAPGAAADLLAALGDTAARSELVAESETSHARLAVDFASGKRLAVRGGGALLAALVVGKRGPEYRSAYVRQPDGSAVYLLRSRLPELLDRPRDDWRDRRIARVPAESVAALEVRRGRSTYRVERGERGGWRLGRAAADSGAVANLLGQFGELLGAGFATPVQAEGTRFDPPSRAIRLLAADGRALLDLRLDSIESGFLGRVEGAATLYRLDQWTVDRLTPPDSTLRP